LTFIDAAAKTKLETAIKDKLAKLHPMASEMADKALLDGDEEQMKRALRLLKSVDLLREHLVYVSCTHTWVWTDCLQPLIAEEGDDVDYYDIEYQDVIKCTATCKREIYVQCMFMYPIVYPEPNKEESKGDAVGSCD